MEYTYHFHTHSNIMTKIGVTFTNPYYSESEDGKTVFEGVLAVDYTLHDISLFLTETYGSYDDIVVMVMEAADPHYLIGISTGKNPYKEVQRDDESMPCNGEEGEDCITVRVQGTSISSSIPLDALASRAARAQANAGFPFGDPVVVKEADDDLLAASYISEAILYSQPGTDLEWIIVVTSPMVRSGADAIEVGDVLFYSVILVAAVGTLCCCVLFTLWYMNRTQRAVMYGDYRFTSAFILGCILMNLTSLVSLGDNTDAMCIARYWTVNLSFSFAIAPLFVKVYRVYTLIGSGSNLQRKVLNHTQTATRMLPIIALEVIILLIFTFVDPPRAVETIDMDPSAPVQHSMQERIQRVLVC